jgi:DNA-binding NarL/FixJ family response regulator
MPARHRILVIADRHLVGEAVRMALISRGSQAASVTLPSSAHEQRMLLRWVASYRPTVGLVLCEVSETRFVKRAAALIEKVSLPWLVLTASTDPRRWGELLSAGAAGILPMTSSLADLADAVDQVAAGTPVMSEPVKRSVIETWRVHESTQRELNRRLRQLSPRERDVLSDLAEGRSVSEIAADRGVAVLTVRTQVKAILRKLDVTSQLAAVAYYRAAREGQDLPRQAREHHHQDAAH